MKWFRVKIPIWPTGYHKLYISYMGHEFGDERTGMYIQVSYNGHLYGPWFHQKRVGDLRQGR